MSRAVPRIARLTTQLLRSTTPKASFSTSIPRFSKMAPIPPTMKAVAISETGPSSVLKVQDVPVPQLQENQVLIRNQYAGVNYIDTYFRTGLYPSPMPLILGREGAGTVVASHPSVQGKFADGAKVVYMAEKTYAQYTAVPAKDVLVVPDGVSMEDAVAILLQGLTALTMIRESADVKADQWTYVAAAAGGVGSVLVQILQTVKANVIASASSDEKLNMLAALGKNPVKRENLLNSKTENVVARIKEITNGHGIDAVFDGIGKSTFDDALEMAALKGTVVSFGNASGAVDPVNILKLGGKNLKLLRPRLFGYIDTREEFEKYANELFGMVKAGDVKVIIHKIYESLDKVKDAHDDIEGRGTQGKLVIKID